jgi:hypothetical protein
MQTHTHNTHANTHTTTHEPPRAGYQADGIADGEWAQVSKTSKLSPRSGDGFILNTYQPITGHWASTLKVASGDGVELDTFKGCKVTFWVRAAPHPMFKVQHSAHKLFLHVMAGSHTSRMSRPIGALRMCNGFTPCMVVRSGPLMHMYAMCTAVHARCGWLLMHVYYAAGSHMRVCYAAGFHAVHTSQAAVGMEGVTELSLNVADGPTSTPLWSLDTAKADTWVRYEVNLEQVESLTGLWRILAPTPLISRTWPVCGGLFWHPRHAFSQRVTYLRCLPCLVAALVCCPQCWMLAHFLVTHSRHILV